MLYDASIELYWPSLPSLLGLINASAFTVADGPRQMAVHWTPASLHLHEEAAMQDNDIQMYDTEALLREVDSGCHVLMVFGMFEQEKNAVTYQYTICSNLDQLKPLALPLFHSLKPQSHQIVLFVDRTIGCDLVSYDRSAMFAAICFYIYFFIYFTIVRCGLFFTIGCRSYMINWCILQFIIHRIRLIV